jgi:hypothetical protein
VDRWGVVVSAAPALRPSAERKASSTLLMYDPAEAVPFRVGGLGDGWGKGWRIDWERPKNGRLQVRSLRSE